MIHRHKWSGWLFKLEWSEGGMLVSAEARPDRQFKRCAKCGKITSRII